LPEPLTSDLFSAALQAVQTTDPLEVAGVVTGIACVWLAARNSVWNFPSAIVSCGLYIIVFGRVRLYSDVGPAAGLHRAGHLWLVGMAAGQRRRPPRAAHAAHHPHPGPADWRWLSGAGLLYAAGAGFLFATYTDAALPYWDSTTTAISLVAQGLLSRRKIENWLLWIGVDVAYVSMYWLRHLYLTSALYAVFLGLAAYGYWQWRQEYRRQLTNPANLLIIRAARIPHRS
jgi:nicotinamide mononucleotide transporter